MTRKPLGHVGLLARIQVGHPDQGRDEVDVRAQRLAAPPTLERRMGDDQGYVVLFLVRSDAFAV